MKQSTKSTKTTSKCCAATTPQSKKRRAVKKVSSQLWGKLAQPQNPTEKLLADLHQSLALLGAAVVRLDHDGMMQVMPPHQARSLMIQVNQLSKELYLQYLSPFNPPAPNLQSRRKTAKPKS